MGCISSKILTKSLSFREDLSHSHRSKRNRIAASGIPDDLLFTSGNGNGTSGDHKFLSKKSQIGSSPKPALEPTDVEMINTWELMAGLEEQEVETMRSLAASSKIVDADKIRRRSKSCHWPPENEGSIPIIDHVGKKGVGRSRSFHTVEEHDAMLERILLSKAQKDDYVQLKPCGASSTMNYQYTQNKNGIQLLSRGKDLVEDNAMVFTSGPDDIKEMFPSNTITITIEESSSFKDVVIQERSIKTKGLESLQIPSAVELQSIGSLREWLLGGGGGGDGCVESHRDYLTPKFGNYDKSWSEFEEEWKEEPILNPELVAAFEEFIQRLEIEGNPDDKDI